ncbi:uncharacterized protein LOC142342467 [Convolutriloba macropyga]|uniref:uncharacterized protein LOC142342467 n=1 Tax=Convolutriloba macropyga TaxID=536237 RepID=UPI003F51C8C0
MTAGAKFLALFCIVFLTTVKNSNGQQTQFPFPHRENDVRVEPTRPGCSQVSLLDGKTFKIGNQKIEQLFVCIDGYISSKPEQELWLPNQLGNLNSVVFAPAFIKNYIVKPEKSFVDGYVNGDWATYDAGIKNLPKEKLPNVTYRFMDFKDSQIMFYLTDEGFDWGLIVTWESVGRPESGELNSFQTVLACRGANPDAKEAKECVYVTVYKELDHVRLNWAEEMDSYLMIGIFGPVGFEKFVIADFSAVYLSASKWLAGSSEGFPRGTYIYKFSQNYVPGHSVAKESSNENEAVDRNELIRVARDNGGYTSYGSSYQGSHWYPPYGNSYQGSHWYPTYGNSYQGSHWYPPYGNSYQGSHWYPTYGNSYQGSHWYPTYGNSYQGSHWYPTYGNSYQGSHWYPPYGNSYQ